MEKKGYWRHKCPECGKLIKTNTGFEWHMYHIHGWKDTSKPSLVKQVGAAMEDKILLEVFCNTLGITVEEAFRILERGY